MQKDEILSKARQEGLLGVDEGTKHMEDRGRMVGRTLFLFVFVVIGILSLITKNEIDYGVRAMFLAYLSGEAYVVWQFKKSRIYLFWSVAAGFVAVLALIQVGCDLFGAAL